MYMRENIKKSTSAPPLYDIFPRHIQISLGRLLLKKLLCLKPGDGEGAEEEKMLFCAHVLKTESSVDCIEIVPKGEQFNPLSKGSSQSLPGYNHQALSW